MGNQTVAQLKGEKISESVTKGVTPPTNLAASNRNDIDAGVSTTKFPFHLSPNRYLEIHIYNTSEGDPNKQLLDVASGVVEQTQQAFKSYIDQGDFINNIKAQLSTSEASETTLNISSIGNLIDGVEQAWKNWTTQLNSFGNPSLPKKFVDVIFLPLPNDIQEQLNYEYSEESGLADTFLQSAIGTPVKEGIEKFTGISNIVSMATGTQALSYNKNLLAKFDRANFREISLTWTLIPNNQKEAVAIQTIITKLKAYSSPQAVAGKLLLRAPFFAKLKFQNKVIDQALQFKEVVITNIEVNWTVSGRMETFHDDNPKTLSLTVTFKDREPKTQEAWTEGNPDIINGNVKG